MRRNVWFGVRQREQRYEHFDRVGKEIPHWGGGIEQRIGHIEGHV